MHRVTVSLSDELLQALDGLAAKRNESRSALVEVLLREHPLIQQAIQRERGPRLRAGRSLEKVLAVADQGRQNRERAVAQGRVRFHV